MGVAADALPCRADSFISLSVHLQPPFRVTSLPPRFADEFACRTLRWVCLACALVSPTATSAAQVAPANAEQLAARLSKQHARLHVALEAGSIYQSNPRLLRLNDVSGRTDALGIVTESAFRLGRTRFNITGDARVYQSAIPDLDRDAYGVRLTAVRRLRPRMTAALTIGTRSALAMEIVNSTAGGGGLGAASPGVTPPQGGAQGVPGSSAFISPTARVRFDDVRLTATTRLSAATSMEVAGFANRSTYNAPGLVGGAGWSTETAFARRLSARMQGNLRLETTSAQSAAVNQPTSRLQSLVIGPTLRLTHVSVRASGGVSRVAQTRLPSVVTPAVNVSLERAFKRGYVTFFVDRRAAPSFGQEQVLINNAIGLTASRSMSRSTDATIVLQQTRSTASSGPKIRFASTTADLTLRQRLFGRVHVSALTFVHTREEIIRVRDLGAALAMAVPLR